MRILTAKEFIKEPCNTLYIKFEPLMFLDQPCIKSEQRGESGESWWELDLLPWPTDTEFYKYLSDNKYELKTEEFCTDDAIYNHDNKILYAVFDKDEIRKIINRLEALL